MTGREHLLGHDLQLVSGSAYLIAPDGKFRFDAPDLITTKPGFQAVAYMITDVVARTLHPNPENSKDIEALESKWFGTAESVIERGRLVNEMLKLQYTEQPRVIAA